MTVLTGYENPISIFTGEHYKMVNIAQLGVITIISGLWSGINLTRFALGELDLSIPSQISVILSVFMFFAGAVFTLTLFVVIRGGGE